MKDIIYWVDPDTLFVKLPCGCPVWGDNDYSTIGMTSYLQVLPTIALYGFKYVVTVDRNRKVKDGDYRVFAARELGIKVPVVFRLYDNHILWRLTRKCVRKIRLRINNYSLFYKKIPNPKFKWGNIVLYCSYQKNIFVDIS